MLIRSKNKMHIVNIENGVVWRMLDCRRIYSSRNRMDART